MNDTQLYIQEILLTSAIYRYTTRNVHLHSQLFTLNCLVCDIPRRTSPLAPPSHPLLPTQSIVNHAHAPATSPTGCRRRGPNSANAPLKINNSKVKKMTTIIFWLVNVRCEHRHQRRRGRDPLPQYLTCRGHPVLTTPLPQYFDKCFILSPSAELLNTTSCCRFHLQCAQCTVFNSTVEKTAFE